jgi:hypothetical protein
MNPSGQQAMVKKIHVHNSQAQRIIAIALAVEFCFLCSFAFIVFTFWYLLAHLFPFGSYFCETFVPSWCSLIHKP